MREIIVEPAKPGEKMSLTPFKLDNKYSNKPCSPTGLHCGSP